MLKRLVQTIQLNLHFSARKRAEWMRKKGIFYEMGENVSIQLHKIPLYPECISFHNNIVIASGVSFATHDAIHAVLNRIPGDKHFVENIGCIEIMDNCFIGANTVILPNVRIGPNVIVAAGSIITKDVPPNSVVGGPQKLLVHLMRSQKSVRRCNLPLELNHPICKIYPLRLRNIIGKNSGRNENNAEVVE